MVAGEDTHFTIDCRILLFKNKSEIEVSLLEIALITMTKYFELTVYKLALNCWDSADEINSVEKPNLL